MKNFGNSEQFLTNSQRQKLVSSYLNQLVTVKIDRPIGYVHHVKGITLHYTVNYGYLPDVIGGDGEEQDVYVLGVSVPLEAFEGRIIGAVYRADDNEDKLIAVPDGVRLDSAQILEQIYFVEQYFDSTVATVFDSSVAHSKKKDL